MLRPMDQVEVAGGEGHFAPVLNPSDLNHIFKIFAVFIAFLGLVISAICSPGPRAYRRLRGCHAVPDRVVHRLWCR